MFVHIQSISENHGDSPIPTVHNTKPTNDEDSTHSPMQSSHSPCITSGSSHGRGSSCGQGSSRGELTCDGTPETENAWKKVKPNSVCWNYYLTPGPKRPFHTNTSPLQLFCRFFTGKVLDLLLSETNRYSKLGLLEPRYA